MYDTVNLWLPFSSTKFVKLDTILYSLKEVTESRKSDGQIFFSGHLGDNYRVALFESGLSLKGSLAKFYLEDNFQTLTRSDTAFALEKMSDGLGICIDQAIVNRLDFAQNIIVDFEPEAYYSLLGYCRYYERLTQPNSIYYSNSLRLKLFYNKIVEGRKKRVPLPEGWHGLNVLRYELRYLCKLSKQFNRSCITAIDLVEEAFYMDLFDRWQEEYSSINKCNVCNFNFNSMKSPKDFWRQMNLLTISTIGQDRIMQEIDRMKHCKTFDQPEYYSRLKRDIRDLCKEMNLSRQSELVDELDKKIANAKRYYR